MKTRLYRPYAKMTAILILFCSLFKLVILNLFQKSKEYFSFNEARGVNPNENKKILKWKLFCNKVYTEEIITIIKDENKIFQATQHDNSVNC